jgi:hypothetical protein
MALDHGTLNIPLSKRGNINAQLDRHNAAQARDRAANRKAASMVIAEQRVTAKALVSKASDERVLQLAIRCNVTPATLRKQLKSDAHWQPELIIKLLSPAA